MSGWQPIETAPKDGTFVLLYLGEPHERSYVVPGGCERYCIGSLTSYGWASVETEDTGSMGSEFTGWMESIDRIVVEPTHWQPLPPAP